MVRNGKDPGGEKKLNEGWSLGWEILLVNHLVRSYLMDCWPYIFCRYDLYQMCFKYTSQHIRREQDHIDPIHLQSSYQSRQEYHLLMCQPNFFLSHLTLESNTIRSVQKSRPVSGQKQDFSCHITESDQQ